MERKKDSSMRGEIAVALNRIANGFELAIAIVLFAAILLMLFELIYGFRELPFFDPEFEFTTFLSKVMTLTIGVEFTKMLCRHTPDTIIDVLMFAIARQLILAHGAALEGLLGVLSIAVLFALRKYVVPKQDEYQGSLLFDLLRRKHQEHSAEKERKKTYTMDDL